MRRMLTLMAALALTLALAAPPARANDNAALDACEGYARYMNDLYVICSDTFGAVSEGLASERIDYAALIKLCERASQLLLKCEWTYDSFDTSGLNQAQTNLIKDIEHMYASRDMTRSAFSESMLALAQLLDNAQYHGNTSLAAELVKFHVADTRLQTQSVIAATNEELVKLDLPEAEAWYNDVFMALDAFASCAAPYETDADLLLMRQHVIIDEMKRVADEYAAFVNSFWAARDAYPTYVDTMMSIGLSESDAGIAAYFFSDAILATKPAPIPEPGERGDDACFKLLMSVAPALVKTNSVNVGVFNVISALDSYLLEPTRDNRLRAVGYCYAVISVILSDLEEPEPISADLASELDSIGDLSFFYGYGNELYELQREYAYTVIYYCMDEMTLDAPDGEFVYFVRDTLADMFIQYMSTHASFRDALMECLPESAREGYWRAFFEGLDMFDYM